MNGNISENPSVVGEGRGAERILPKPEEISAPVAEIISQIRNIRKSGEPGAFDAMVGNVAERLRADPTQTEAAQMEVNFAERVLVIQENKRGMRQEFEGSIRRALLPVAAAFALNISPALAAQESQTDRPVTTPETTLAAKTEARELKTVDMFDSNSSLAVIGEKMKALKREMLPEELVIVKDFSEKVWREKNEWMAVSGKGKDGRFHSEIKEAGSAGGEMGFDILGTIEKEQAVTHTHPVEVGSVIGLSSQTIRNIRSGEANPFVMPPSVVDIGQCMNDADTATVQRVVDPRGVWEYRCDENHPFVKVRKQVTESLSIIMETIKAKYNVREEDTAQASAAIGTTHPALMIQTFFSELDKKYPGLEKSGQEVLSKIIAANSDFALTLLNFDERGAVLTRASMDLSEKELSGEIRNFIQDAEKMGIYMTYTPFKGSTRDQRLQETLLPEISREGAAKEN